MILIQKADFGESFVRAFIRKYFRTEDANEILEKDDQTLINTILEIQKAIHLESTGKEFFSSF